MICFGNGENRTASHHIRDRSGVKFLSPVGLGVICIQRREREGGPAVVEIRYGVGGRARSQPCGCFLASVEWMGCSIQVFSLVCGGSEYRRRAFSLFSDARLGEDKLDSSVMIFKQHFRNSYQ